MADTDPAQRRLRLHQILKEKWGYDSFRPLQLDIIESLLDGRDTIGLMPTGGGKSITFQVPALYASGLTLVITPLISLMKDQTDALRRRHIRAVYFHAGMTSSEIRIAWDMISNGKAKFIYCSPERLRNISFCEELRRLPVDAIVVDEAHCISQWGYDFRPDYLRIAELRNVLEGVPVLALTATATPRVISDIREILRMKSPGIFVKSFRRDNLSYIVRHTSDKDAETLHILTRTSGTAIVYVRSRKRTVEISRWLNDRGISALPYHAGMSFEDKERNQDRWMRGEVRVITATNAFGMGIDKPDVRLVVHYDFPSSLEEYYQEAGRAGRDTLPAFAVLLATPHDKATLRRRLSECFPPRPDVKKLYEIVCVFLGVGIGEGYGRLYEFEISRLCENFRLHERFVRAALKILGNSGLMALLDDIDMRSRAMVVIPREDLYHLSGLSPHAEKTLMAMLRLYTGLFADLVVIDEVRIGRQLNVDTPSVYEALTELRRGGIISYVPRRRVPYIHFPTAREETAHIKIPVEVYESRREQMELRIDSMLGYAFDSSSCRVRRVLEYFGETDAGDCGTCDVCRAIRPTRAARQITLSDAAREILERLEASPRGIEIRSLSTIPEMMRPVYKEAARVLILEGKIAARGGRYVLTCR